MGVAYVALGLSLRKGIYMGHLQWNSMRESLAEWANLYRAGLLGMGDTTFARDGKHFTDTACPTQGPWFRNFMIGYQLRIGVIKKRYFGVTSDMVQALLVGWDIE